MHLHFDSVGGASGDMVLGALAALGVPMADIEQALRALPVESLAIHPAPFGSHGLNGVRVTVETPQEGSPHRGLGAICGLIEHSDLPGPVQEKGRAVFTRLAEAEAEVHATSPDKIHFHEVGAMDAIVDVLGACLALHQLKVGSVSMAPLPLGRGTLQCAHGVYPIPAPATALLLKGRPVVQTDEPYELVTPTGAALLSTWCDTERAPPGSRIVKIGYGFGHRQLNGRPNVLRATLFETAPPEGEDCCLVLETQVDDTTPELLGHLTGCLLGAGALDVFTTSVQMKKQRPGTLLTVLCHPADRDTMLDLVFEESTTLGVREYMARRTVLPRHHQDVSTRYGTVRVKVGTWRGKEVTRAPEMEDCLRLAQTSGVPARTVYEAACRAAFA